MKALRHQPPGRSWAQGLAALSEDERNAWLATLTPNEKEALLYRWSFWARPPQLCVRRGIVNADLAAS